MRAVGLDIGERRVGIARTDETGVLAVPHGVFQRRGSPEDLEELAEIIRGIGAEALVVGLPLNMDGTEGPQAQKVRDFALALAQNLGLPLFFMDERWTTKEAERAMREAKGKLTRRKGKVDELSAVLILQAWLDSRTLV